MTYMWASKTPISRWVRAVNPTYIWVLRVLQIFVTFLQQKNAKSQTLVNAEVMILQQKNDKSRKPLIANVLRFCTYPYTMYTLAGAKSAPPIRYTGRI